MKKYFYIYYGLAVYIKAFCCSKKQKAYRHAKNFFIGYGKQCSIHRKVHSVYKAIGLLTKHTIVGGKKITHTLKNVLATLFWNFNISYWKHKLLHCYESSKQISCQNIHLFAEHHKIQINKHTYAKSCCHWSPWQNSHWHHRDYDGAKHINIHFIATGLLCNSDPPFLAHPKHSVTSMGILAVKVLPKEAYDLQLIQMCKT